MCPAAGALIIPNERGITPGQTFRGPGCNRNVTVLPPGGSREIAPRTTITATGYHVVGSAGDYGTLPW